jgi:hypothetical protein
MRTTSHAALRSFLFSAILASALIPCRGGVALASAGAPAFQSAVESALNGLRNEGFSDVSQLALPAPADSPAYAPAADAPAPTGTLTPELMDKIVRLLAQQGTDTELNSRFANALGLTLRGQTWPDRITTVKPDADSADDYSIAINRGGDQDIVLYLRIPHAIHAFRAHRDGTVVKAFVSDPQGIKIYMMSPERAQEELNEHIDFWAGSVDQLLAGQ